MDDLPVTTESVPGYRRILKGLEKLMDADAFQTSQVKINGAEKRKGG